ncbi:MAG: glucuronate isomerase [Kiritimatiellaeota bacterium]|nr:glucuronate isomerase [Kiritimatiellota bacterium]
MFITDDFLLSTESARILYHDYAARLPIVDYHCHLSPKEIADDIRWENIAQPWLGGDHYKWRALRANGVEERFITGDAPAREKFQKFAETMPYLLRNPIYHWSHLELARYFGIDDILLSADTAQEIWDRSAEALASPDFSARGLMRKSNVEVVCTTDDPVDTLEHHAAIAADPSIATKILPAWRPDKALKISDPAAWNAYLAKLEAASDTSISTLCDFIAALKKRHNYFESHGCRLSDYGLGAIPGAPLSDNDAKAVFLKVRGGITPESSEIEGFASFMLRVCAWFDAESDWTMQIHYNALRNNNSKMFRALGADTGFDSMGDWRCAENLSRLLDDLDSANHLPRTILYSLNPTDNEMLAAMLGNFQSAPVPGKMQLGSGWWFNDQIDGMRRQIEALSQIGLISRFVGMLTDSRSFLSYTRHEYFRRILCDIFGADIERGILPRDHKLIGSIIADISYHNAVNYFAF